MELCQHPPITNSVLSPALPTCLASVTVAPHYPHSCPTIGPGATLASLQDFIFIKTLPGLFTMPHSIEMPKPGPRKAR